jgi:hypothetical protein
MKKRLLDKRKISMVNRKNDKFGGPFRKKKTKREISKKKFLQAQQDQLENQLKALKKEFDLLQKNYGKQSKQSQKQQSTTKQTSQQPPQSINTAFTNFPQFL